MTDDAPGATDRTAPSTAHDRPTAAELVAAVREFLARDVLTATEGRVQFHTRVAVNVLGMVERELDLGAQQAEAAHARLVALTGGSGSVRDLDVALARDIRSGALDARRDEVLAVLRDRVRAKLAVANPGYAPDPQADSQADSQADPAAGPRPADPKE